MVHFNACRMKKPDAYSLANIYHAKINKINNVLSDWGSTNKRIDRTDAYETNEMFHIYKNLLLKER